MSKNVHSCPLTERPLEDVVVCQSGGGAAGQCVCLPSNVAEFELFKIYHDIACKLPSWINFFGEDIFYFEAYPLFCPPGPGRSGSPHFTHARYNYSYHKHTGDIFAP